MLSIQSITYCFAAASYVMWNIPSMDMAGELMLTVPACQKPFMAVWLFTADFVFCAGPMGVAGLSPLQVQLPSKNLSWAISGAGFGAAMAAPSAGLAAGLAAGLPPICANVQGAAASTAAQSTPTIERTLIVVSSSED